MYWKQEKNYFTVVLNQFGGTCVSHSWGCRILAQTYEGVPTAPKLSPELLV